MIPIPLCIIGPKLDWMLTMFSMHMTKGVKIWQELSTVHRYCNNIYTTPPPSLNDPLARINKLVKASGWRFNGSLINDKQSEMLSIEGDWLLLLEDCTYPSWVCGIIGTLICHFFYNGFHKSDQIARWLEKTSPLAGITDERYSNALQQLVCTLSVSSAATYTKGCRNFHLNYFYLLGPG